MMIDDKQMFVNKWPCDLYVLQWIENFLREFTLDVGHETLNEELRHDEWIHLKLQLEEVPRCRRSYLIQRILMLQ